MRLPWTKNAAITNQELAGRVKTLELEWEEMYDKFRRLYARISKRAERLEALEEKHPEGTVVKPGVAPEPPVDINARIRANRRANAIPGTGTHQG